MGLKQISGIIFAILGLIFIIFPLFSAESVSVIVGLSLLFFGFTSFLNGFSIMGKNKRFASINMAIGIIAIIFGLLFIFAIKVLPALAGLQIYIVGFIMIVFGAVGIISKSKISKSSSLLILVMGVIALALAIYSISQPIYIAILLGLCLIIQGVRFYLDDD